MCLEWVWGQELYCKLFGHLFVLALSVEKNNPASFIWFGTWIPPVKHWEMILPVLHAFSEACGWLYLYVKYYGSYHHAFAYAISSAAISFFFLVRPKTQLNSLRNLPWIFPYGTAKSFLGSCIALWISLSKRLSYCMLIFSLFDSLHNKTVIYLKTGLSFYLCILSD